MLIPSVSMSFWYWKMRLFSTSVSIFLKSFLVKDWRLILFGRRPKSSGIISVGLVVLNAPAQIKRIFVVLTSPYLVDIVVPSMRGRRSLWTPSLLGFLPVVCLSWLVNYYLRHDDLVDFIDEYDSFVLNLVDCFLLQIDFVTQMMDKYCLQDAPRIKNFASIPLVCLAEIERPQTLFRKNLGKVAKVFFD